MLESTFLCSFLFEDKLRVESRLLEISKAARSPKENMKKKKNGN